jgi:hypothetical protein
MNNNEYKGYTFATPEYSYRIEPNPTTKNVFLSAETPDAIEMAIDSIELAGTQEGEWHEDLLLEMNGDAPDAFCFFVEVSKPTLALFINFELLNFLGTTPENV